MVVFDDIVIFICVGGCGWKLHWSLEGIILSFVESGGAECSHCPLEMVKNESHVELDGGG